jgi:hypothetical protein
MENPDLSLILLPWCQTSIVRVATKLATVCNRNTRSKQMGVHSPEENGSIWKVFSAQPEVPISSPFQFLHFSSNDSSRVITVLFTNEVWKIGERRGCR